MVLPDFSEDCLALPIGQFQVQKDAIGRRIKLGQPLLDRRGFDDFPTREGEGEDSTQESPGLLVILDDQHPVPIHRYILGGSIRGPSELPPGSAPGSNI
jgi:hypothetical protein